VIRWIIEGQFKRPLRVIAFNTGEEWSRDVTREIAGKLLDLNNMGRLWVRRLASLLSEQQDRSRPRWCNSLRCGSFPSARSRETISQGTTRHCRAFKISPGVAAVRRLLGLSSVPGDSPSSCRDD